MITVLGFNWILRDKFGRLEAIVPQACVKCGLEHDISVCNNLQCPVCGGNVRSA